MEEKLIWYVCYGSNLCYDRFMCYLTGNGNDKYGLSQNSKRICNDQTPPRKVVRCDIPFELYFARKSRTWNHQGVCFIDDNVKSYTIGRAYLISIEQYEHIWSKEGKNDWYSKQIELGKIDGIRAVTFTSPKRDVPNNEPYYLYYNVVKDGLVECGLSIEEAENYLNERIHK